MSPPAARTRRRVVACVTDGARRDPVRLLVIRHVEFPALRPQLPGGTLEPGESVVTGALRESAEETSLTALRVVAHLGARLIGPPRSMAAETLDTRFVHLEHARPTPGSWASVEATPHEGGPPVAYVCEWAALDALPPLDARDALAVPLLRASLARARPVGRERRARR